MFSNLRQGSQLHILHKVATPYVEIGTIENAPSIPMLGYYPNMPSIPMDITVRVGDKTTTYQQIPSASECAEVTERSTGEKVFIACNKEAVNSELQTMRQDAFERINSVGFYEQRIKAIDALICKLNPEIAEKQAQAQEIIELRKQVQDMQQIIADMRASSSNQKED